MKTHKQRPLGASQKGVLKTLCRWPGWAYGRSWERGWVWSTDSGTRAILESLCRRGLVELRGQEYHPTQAGKALAEAE